ncbi:hypothetical protein BDV38DRAFT_281168 [Aspergillus pseudotamarii]|uniref:Uncharacterized protein n=1 Tax=Aspergillus pseudotamarii TaxID=132259 RepID=A0A5N6T021_ASPPS|nr:uncharacterized protein BDV38DRAFT_281168 [Aspergillus pseudotamarii]KAE8139399.1 hypothetical protein BDV38DRAFT_281168 [Aspergillus pseudotamarii]
MRFFWLLSSLFVTATIAAPLTPEEMGCPPGGGVCTNPNGYSEEQLAQMEVQNAILRLAEASGTTMPELCARLGKDKVLEGMRKDLPAIVSLCK